MSFENTVLDLFAKIEGWLKYAMHHAKHNTPPAATIPEAPAPAPEPAPPPAPAPEPAPPPVASSPDWAASQPDERGFVKLAAIEAERASNPAWANATAWYAFEATLSAFQLNDAQKLSVQSNLQEAKSLMMINGGDAPAFDSRSLNTAYTITPGNGASQYTRGEPYSDALSFIGTNLDAQGNVTYKSPAPEDLAAFIANCKASGNLPIIDHKGFNPYV